jgi:CRISPR system Cascade subunit CasA
MGKTMHYSLLDEPVITVRYQNGETKATNLPSILSGLLDHSIVSFEALQPHQQQAWYSFLVQLAAMAVARENNGDIPTTPDSWRELLLNLANGSEAAWHLVVDDVSKPAFMQPPVPEGSLEEAKYKSKFKTPDGLDMLVTSKNHDLKGNRILEPETEHWLFALITLQTMEGYGGKFNYEISRMNKGGGNRPLLSMAPKLTWNSRFNRDLKVFLEYRSQITEFYQENGYSLLWTIFWNGSKNDCIQVYECDPFFIEICRRIRLKKTATQIHCLNATTKSPRIYLPDKLKGTIYDPWMPIKSLDTKVLTVGRKGFTYKLIQQILLGESYIKPQALEFQSNESMGLYLICQATARGGKKTETNGLHRRFVKISPKISSILLREKKLENKLAKRSSERVALASITQKKILFPALSELIKSGSKQKVDYKYLAKKIDPWIARFDQEIDRRFFESLWTSVEMEYEEAKCQWEKILLSEAEKILNEAERSIPISQIRRFRTISNARSKFYGKARETFDYVWEHTPLK